MEDVGISETNRQLSLLRRARTVISAPKEYFLAPIFAAAPQTGAREVTVENHRYLIGGFHPMGGTNHPPALDVRHARAIFSLLSFRSEYDGRLICFSFNELCMRYAQSNGGRYTNSGGSNDCAICFPLIPTEEYNGPPQKPYSYEGRTAVYENQSFTLGPKIKFVARARTLQEEVSLLQRQYTYGGLFAVGKTYREMLLEFLEDEGITQGLTVAIEAGLTRENLPATQSEMLQQLGKLTDNMDGKPSVSQTTLPGF